jgi:hypothetical protein
MDKGAPGWTNNYSSVTLAKSPNCTGEASMSLNARLAELSEKHRMLEKKIAEEMTRPAADTTKIARWKHEKLRLKDEMAKIEPQTRH